MIGLPNGGHSHEYPIGLDDDTAPINGASQNGTGEPVTAATDPLGAVAVRSPRSAVVEALVRGELQLIQRELKALNGRL